MNPQDFPSVDFIVRNPTMYQVDCDPGAQLNSVQRQCLPLMASHSHDDLWRKGYKMFSVPPCGLDIDGGFMDSYRTGRPGNRVFGHLSGFRMQEIRQIAEGVLEVKMYAQQEAMDKFGYLLKLNNGKTLKTNGQIQDECRRNLNWGKGEEGTRKMISLYESLPLDPHAERPGLLVPYPNDFNNYPLIDARVKSGVYLSTQVGPLATLERNQRNGKPSSSFKKTEGINLEMNFFAYAGSAFATHIEDGYSPDSITWLMGGTEDCGKVIVVNPPSYLNEIREETYKVLDMIPRFANDPLYGKSKESQCILQHKGILLMPKFFKTRGIPCSIVCQGKNTICWLAAHASHGGWNLSNPFSNAVNSVSSIFHLVFQPDFAQCRGVDSSHEEVENPEVDIFFMTEEQGMTCRDYSVDLQKTVISFKNIGGSVSGTAAVVAQQQPQTPSFDLTDSSGSHEGNRLCQETESKKPESKKRSSLDSQSKTIRRQHMCPNCSKMFSQKSHLDKHVRNNSCNKRHYERKCALCNQEFDRHRDLVRHNKNPCSERR